MLMQVNIDKSWQAVLSSYTDSPEFKTTIKLVGKDYSDKGKTVYPPSELVFNALAQAPFDNVKVVILGQDPYHNPGQAHGLSFSVPAAIKAPPSLVNIFKELNADMAISRTNTDLTDWAEQGVLLLNSTLTVLKNQPTSHSNFGWEDFTDYIIKSISDKKENVVFILWGAYAKSKRALIDTNKHLVLESPHPSPLSAYRGFFGSRPFSKTNTYLKSHGLSKIVWL